METSAQATVGDDKLPEKVLAVLREAETKGVPVADLREAFLSRPASYSQLLRIFERLNAFGFWVLEDGSARIFIGRGEVPQQLFLSSIGG